MIIESLLQEMYRNQKKTGWKLKSSKKIFVVGGKDGGEYGHDDRGTDGGDDDEGGGDDVGGDDDSNH